MSRHRLFRSTLTVSGMTFVSRLLGFVRDVMLATDFGAGPYFDAFVVAFKIPNFMRRLFGEGAFIQAFVPILSEYQANSFQKETYRFVRAIIGSLGTIVLLVVIFIEISAPWTTVVFAPGFSRDPTQLRCVVYMLRITSPYLLLISLTALTGAVLNVFDRYASSAFSPVLLNISMIATVWFWIPYASTPIYALAWSVLIGGFLQLITQLPFLFRLGFSPIPKWQWRNPGIIRVLKSMVPTLFGVSVAQIGLVIDNFFASFLRSGSISWLYYSDRLVYFPLGVVGVALATVVLPNLSWCYSLKSVDSYSSVLDWALRVAASVGIPVSVALFALSGPLLATLIFHGVFTTQDVFMTQKSLWAFSIGLPWFMFVKILASAFYSRQDVKTPVKTAAVAMAVNLILNALLVHPLAHAGLALSTSLAAACNTGLLLFSLLRRSIYKLDSKWPKLILQLLIANVAMGLVIFQFSGNVEKWLIWTMKERICHLLVVIFLGIITYLAILWITGLRISDFRLPTTIDAYDKINMR
ncbi:murein biosynthesis integral membrane protein MurJ [Coxiella endosymbiont of Amblyomma sculptum]|uniref:murein biosynthesis integral membrane protein MurJ n=1 Tax=Coxiella endosymbiont of Amblyomma sculptum TaxID=2487929 RepID=UPI00132F340E|nr:murein biosynthesis integral membrane protein MurJ [Coxiella endosymbiont of Amblyomma sculptum]QHG92492.1 murein biosynthesis integral membrane protein MurJ [Coxiella endosymbiont of Amblyomma sculptum]